MNPIRLPKELKLTKEDPLNLPRHLAYNSCTDFEECPLCYKCRSCNPALYKCRSCSLYEKGMICNREKHTPNVISMMIVREVIDLRKNKEGKERQ